MQTSAITLSQPRQLMALLSAMAGAAAAICFASFAIEPFSMKSDRLPIWLGVAAAIFVLYSVVTFWLMSAVPGARLLRYASVPLSALFLGASAQLFLRPA